MTEAGGKLPWMKFCPGDWRSDAGLRVCSLAARGLWIEMVSIMHEAAPRGSLVMNGKPMSSRQLCALSGASVDEVAAALTELRDAGVFSEEADGTIYSRRMRRDDAKANADRLNGGKGGNPRLNPTNATAPKLGKPDDNGGVNPQANPQPNPPVNDDVNGGDKAKKLEARDQSLEARGQSQSEIQNQSEKQESREDRASLGRDLNTAFDRFWEAWPNKVGKPDAKRSFAKAFGRTKSRIDPILEGVAAYIAGKPPDRQWLNPATFLNQDRWEDRPALPMTRAGPPPSAQVSALTTLQRMANGQRVDDDLAHPQQRRAGLHVATIEGQIVSRE